MAKKLLTDLDLLEKIYNDYYSTFTSKEKERSSKMYVPIDVVALAKSFSVDPDIIFGRLYYYLDKKYGYVNEDGSKVPLFSIKVGSDKHAVQFPLLGAVIAGLREERNKYITATWLSVIATLISITSLVISLMLTK